LHTDFKDRELRKENLSKLTIRTLSDALVVVTTQGTSSSVYVHHCATMAQSSLQTFKIINRRFYPGKNTLYFFKNNHKEL